MGNVQITDVTASIWVAASAGTGKTKSLIDRIIALLVCGVSPSKILCLTYTKNAATEMMLRLNSFIYKWSSATNQEIISDLNKMGLSSIFLNNAKNLSNQNIKIETIHSFCQDIIDSFPVESGVMPNNHICSDSERDKLIESAYLRVLQNTDLHQDISFVLRYKSSILNIFKENIQVIRKFFEHYKVDNRDDISKMFQMFFGTEDFCDADENQIPELLCQECHKKLAANIAQSIQLEYPDYADILLKFAINPSYNITDIFLKADGEQKSRVVRSEIIRKLNIESELQELADLAFQINEQRNNLILFKLNVSFMHVAFELHKQYTYLKNNGNVIDYDDIIITAANILKNHAHVRQAVDNMIEHVLVDEAQDTSTSQWDIVKLITSEFFTNQDSQKTVFVVGDYKQSIYSFQGADFELFSTMHDYFKEQVVACGQKWYDVKLNTSYRSGQAIIQFVNQVFDSTFPDSKHLTIRMASESRVIINPIYKIDSDPEKQLASLKQIACDIAEYINNFIKSKTFLPSKMRAAQPGDFMLLSQRRSMLQTLIADELRKVNINCSSSDRLILSEELIVEDILSLMKFCVFPNDDLNLAILLKSPIIGISEDELFELCTGRGNASLWNYLCERYSELCEKLNRYISTISPYEFLMQMIINGDADKLVNHIGGNSSDAFNALLDACLEYQNTNPSSIASFVKWVETSQILVKKDNAPNKDTVSMITVHASKGLQAPVVIILDAAFVNKKFSSIVSCGNDFVFLSHTGINTAIVRSFAEAIKNREYQESKRLLYVALTRAEDHLAVYSHTSLKQAAGNSWYSFIKSSFHEIEDYNTTPKVMGENFKIASEEMDNGLMQKHKYPVFSVLPEPKKYDSIKNISEIYGEFVHLMLEKLPLLKIEDWPAFANSQKTELPMELKEEAYDEAVSVITDDKFKVIFENSISSEPELCANNELKRIDKLCKIGDNIVIIDFKTGAEDNNNSSYRKQVLEYKKLVKDVVGSLNVKAYILWTKSKHLVEIDDHSTKLVENIIDKNMQQVDFGW